MTLTLIGKRPEDATRRKVNPECDGKEAKMADAKLNDFVPPEMRIFAEQSVRQAKKAFEDLMGATQRVVSMFEGQASSA
jgi:hypothetical protein